MWLTESEKNPIYASLLPILDACVSLKVSMEFSQVQIRLLTRSYYRKESAAVRYTP